MASGISRPITGSHQEIKEKIAARVSQLGDQRAVISCQDITERFLRSHTIYRKQEVLRMLLKLS